MVLKERIAEAIEGSGMTRAEIARACGVTNAAVTHWLNGDTASLKAEVALSLEAATGFRAQWILSGRGSKKTTDVYWPFSFPIDRFESLSERQKGIVETRLLQAIEECEAAKSNTKGIHSELSLTSGNKLSKNQAEKKFGPALTKAFGEDLDESGQAGRVQKPGGRRRA